MQIDWITVAAQIINFLVLVWLLRRFLYRPVIDAMAKREKHIFDRLNDAEERELVANNTIQEYTEQRTILLESRKHYLSETKELAEQKRKELLKVAQHEIEQKRRQWVTDLEKERCDYLDKIRDYSIQSVQQFTRQTLEDLANTELESELVNVFLQRLVSMDSKTRSILLQSSDPLLVNTSFALDKTTEACVTKAIQKQLGDNVDIHFALSAKLICGLELRTRDYHIGWTLANHLDDLDTRIEQALSK